MDPKSRRLRYTRQWKCARRSLAERIIKEPTTSHPTPAQQDLISNDIDNDTDKDILNVYESMETRTSEENCSSGHETEDIVVDEEHCSSGNESENDGVSEERCSLGPKDMDEMPAASLTQFLQEWATKHSIKHNAVDDLLKGLKKNGHPELPSTARTLLQTPRNITTVMKSGMQCVHFNLRETLTEQLQYYPSNIIDEITTIELSFNIDGLPLFKSSKTQLWPILCAIHLTPIKVFPVTLTLGPSKPTNLDFIEEAVTEIQELLDNGLEGKQVKLRCVVCDAPARAMVKKIKQYSGYYGCDKCTQRGMWVSGRVTFPEVDNLTLRTNDTYRAEMRRRFEEEAISMSPFVRLHVNMIDQFPIDYMHQACLGVTKKMITEWMRGDRNVRMSARQINEVSQRLLALRKAIPSSFVRKPRGLEDIDRWKATELRQFAVYTGKIALKGILPDHLYDHFMTFSVALGLLLSPNTAVENNSYSSELMAYFVAKTKELYGDHFMVYNIHCMTHLSAEAKNFGSLDACSAFPFENFLGKLKRLVRSGKQPLVQVAKRCVEMSHFPLQQSVVPAKNKTKRPNNAFILEEGKCCVAIEEREEMDETGSPMLVCRIFEKPEPLFREPCDSRIIGCFKVQSRQYTIKLLPERQLTRTAIMVEENQELLFLAILHTL